jgi:butyrate kinase
MKADQPINVAAAVLIYKGNVLMARRHGGYLDKLWEFPGGKLEKDETAEAAVQRELKEELDIDVIPHKTILILEHSYPDKTIRLHFVSCSFNNPVNDNALKIDNNPETSWFSPAQLPLTDICPADRIASNNIPWQLLIKKEQNNSANEPFILVINPGSLTTKIAVFKGLEIQYEEEITYTKEDLKDFKSSIDQLDLRYNSVVEVLKKAGYKSQDFSAAIGRGGPIKPMVGGIYKVNKQLLDDLVNGMATDHASLLGGLIAYKISASTGMPAFIADPVSCDEYIDLAKISGCPDCPRISLNHHLNVKSVAEEVAEADGTTIDKVNYVVAHLGGGFTICPLEKGKMIDGNNTNDEGPMTPARAGSLPLQGLMKLCFSGKYDYKTLRKRLNQDGGLMEHLGTGDCREISKRIEAGDEKARLILEAMAYQISKWIGAMAAALKGKVDAIILTGGIAHNKYVVDWVKERVSWIAPVRVRPGQNELLALAKHAYKAINNPSIAKDYK